MVRKEVRDMLEVPTEIVKLLMEIGYIAVGQGLYRESRAIFEALRRARENSEYPLIGLAVCELNAGQGDVALKLLEEAENLNSENYLIKSFKGLAYKVMGEIFKAKEVLEDVLSNTEQKDALNLARALLDEIS